MNEYKVTLEIIGTSCTQQSIEVPEDKSYMVFGNIRKEADIFNPYYYCSFCDPLKEKYISKVMLLPKTNLTICRGCLHKFDRIISTAILSDCEKGR